MPASCNRTLYRPVGVPARRCPLGGKEGVALFGSTLPRRVCRMARMADREMTSCVKQRPLASICSRGLLRALGPVCQFFLPSSFPILVGQLFVSACGKNERYDTEPCSTRSRSSYAARSCKTMQYTDGWTDEWNCGYVDKRWVDEWNNGRMNV